MASKLTFLSKTNITHLDHDTVAGGVGGVCVMALDDRKIGLAIIADPACGSTKRLL